MRASAFVNSIQNSLDFGGRHRDHTIARILVILLRFLNVSAPPPKLGQIHEAGPDSQRAMGSLAVVSRNRTELTRGFHRFPYRADTT